MNVRTRVASSIQSDLAAKKPLTLIISSSLDKAHRNTENWILRESISYIRLFQENESETLLLVEF